MCSVLSELFANAIEHGLLKLDSSLKDDPDGFLTFYQQREECMEELDEHLWVKLDIDYNPKLEHVIFHSSIMAKALTISIRFWTTTKRMDEELFGL